MFWQAVESDNVRNIKERLTEDCEPIVLGFVDIFLTLAVLLTNIYVELHKYINYHASFHRLQIDGDQQEPNECLRAVCCH